MKQFVICLSGEQYLNKYNRENMDFSFFKMCDYTTSEE